MNRRSKHQTYLDSGLMSQKVQRCCWCQCTHVLVVTALVMNIIVSQDSSSSSHTFPYDLCIIMCSLCSRPATQSCAPPATRDPLPATRHHSRDCCREASYRPRSTALPHPEQLIFTETNFRETFIKLDKSIFCLDKTNAKLYQNIHPIPPHILTTFETSR